LTGFQNSFSRAIICENSYFFRKFENGKLVFCKTILLKSEGDMKQLLYLFSKSFSGKCLSWSDSWNCNQRRSLHLLFSYRRVCSTITWM